MKFIVQLHLLLYSMFCAHGSVMPDTFREYLSDIKFIQHLTFLTLNLVYNI